MDWRLFGGAFLMIFLAELGDKTQLAALGLVKNPADRWTVFAGAILALALSTLIAVLAGGWLSARIPPFWFKLAAGTLFLAFGLATLRDAYRLRVPAPATATDAAAVPSSGEVWSWPARAALEAAATFEEATARRYRRLSDATVRPAVASLLARMAEEEKEHVHRLRALSGAHGDDALSGGVPAVAPDVDAYGRESGLARAFPSRETDAPASLTADERRAVDALREHEEATARFYETLAERARLDSLRHAFTQLASAERAHAAALRDILAHASHDASDEGSSHA